MMVVRLRDYLAVPYMLEAETIEVAGGAWVSRVSYPELPGCVAQAAVVEEALRTLERQRIETILAMVEAGKEPPVPRPPLRLCDPAWIAAEAGLPQETVARIARDQLKTPDDKPR
jgi:predicted RNase H-like HicB family nuclease